MSNVPDLSPNRTETAPERSGSGFVSSFLENGWPDFVKDQVFEGASTNPAAGIKEELLLRCTHCGMCTSNCPTFAEDGDENDGPRGRIQIMRMVAEGQCELTDRMRRHLERCLDCRGCETACPSGVEYGKIIEPFCLALKQSNTTLENRFDWFRDLILFQLFPYAERLRWLLTPIRLAQRLKLYDLAERLGVFSLLTGRLGRLLPMLPAQLKTGPKLPKFLPAVGRKRARVAFFTGCVADAIFRPSHWATLRVLQQNGCDIFIPPDQACCGAIHFHAGNSVGARQLADQNLVAFELDRYDAIVVNHGGCGAMLKEYGQHWHDGLQPHREKFASKIRDVHELLDELGLVPPSGRIAEVATYHDACHLAHAQGVVDAPRRLLAKIPGLELRELPESNLCCGSAGTYYFNQPEMSDRLSRRKMENILSTGARLVLAANAGCLLQIQKEVHRNRYPLKVLHTMDLLDMSYRGVQPSE